MHVLFLEESSSCCSAPQSCSTLWPHELLHTRLPCPSPSPAVCSNSCPLSQWCHPSVSSSVIPVPSCLQSFRASWSFPMCEFFSSGGQSIGAPASASVLPVNLWGWFPLGLTGLISLISKDYQESSSAPQLEGINSSVFSLFIVWLLMTNTKWPLCCSLVTVPHSTGSIINPELNSYFRDKFYFSSRARLPISLSIYFALSSQDYSIWTSTGFLYMYVKLAIKKYILVSTE